MNLLQKLSKTTPVATMLRVNDVKIVGDIQQLSIVHMQSRVIEILRILPSLDYQSRTNEQELPIEQIPGWRLEISNLANLF